MPNLRCQLIIHLRSPEGSGVSWAAEALKANHVAVEDAMVEQGMVCKAVPRGLPCRRTGLWIGP
jgi:hypothetical protein